MENKDKPATPHEDYLREPSGGILGGSMVHSGMTKREHMAPKAPPRPSWFVAEELEGKPEDIELSFEYIRKTLLDIVISITRHHRQR